MKWKWTSQLSRTIDNRWITKISFWKNWGHKRNFGRPKTRWYWQFSTTVASKCTKMGKNRVPWGKPVFNNRRSTAKKQRKGKGKVGRNKTEDERKLLYKWQRVYIKNHWMFSYNILVIRNNIWGKVFKNRPSKIC